MAVRSVAAEKDRVLDVHFEKVLYHVQHSVRLFAVVPIGRDRLVVTVDPGAGVVLVHAKECGDGLGGSRFTVAVELREEG